MTRSAVLAIGLTLSVVIGFPVAAQVAGTYHGTGTNGSSIYFIISKDAATGAMEVTNNTVYVNQTCSDRSSNQFGLGYSPDVDVVDGRARNTEASQNSTVGWSLNFAANGRKASGKLYTYGAKLDPIGAHPKRAFICSPPQEDFVVKLQSGGASEPAAQPIQGWMSPGKIYQAPVGPAFADAPE